MDLKQKYLDRTYQKRKGLFHTCLFLTLQDLHLMLCHLCFLGVQFTMLNQMLYKDLWCRLCNGQDLLCF